MHVRGGWMRAVSLLALVFAVTVTAAAQTTPSGAKANASGTVSTTTRAVLLDVVVRDNKGRPVHGLAAGDFQIFEDDHLETVASLEESAADPVHPDEDAQLLLLVDEMNSEFEDVGYVRHCLHKLLLERKGPLPQRTGLLALTNDGLVVLHEPTLDGRSIWASLERHRTALPWRQLGGFYGQMERMDLSFGALHEIAMSAVGSRSRRALVWISPGFPLRATINLTSETQTYISEAIRRLSDELLRARMSIYSIDPRVAMPAVSGVSTTNIGLSEGLRMLQGDGNFTVQDLTLPRFAAETGGRSVWGRNDIDAQVANSAEDESNYYTVLYYPSNRNFNGKYRTIRVKVSRPGLEVRSRTGYFAMPIPPSPTPEDVKAQLETALSNPLPFAGLPIRARIDRVSNSQDAELEVLVDRPDVSARITDAGESEYELLAGTVVYSEDGKAIQGKAHGFSKTIATGTNVGKAIKLVMPINIAQSASRMRIVVRDSISGKLGSTEIDLQKLKTSAP